MLTDKKDDLVLDAKVCPRCGGRGYAVIPFGIEHRIESCNHPQCKAKK